MALDNPVHNKIASLCSMKLDTSYNGGLRRRQQMIICKVREGSEKYHL